MAEVFSLSKPLWKIAVRATVVYLALVVLVRIIPKRKAGHISPNDMLALIVIGGMGSSAITGDSSSVGEILLMVGLIVAWGYVIDILEYRFPALRRALRDRQTPLIQDGRFLRGNMRREMITEEELMAVLREEGVDDPLMIHSACLEADGHISLIKKDEAGEGDQPKRK